MSTTQQQPFLVAAYADPTHQYELTSYEAFLQIYEPQGFYIVGGTRVDPAVQERIRYLEEQRAALASKEDSDANPPVELPDEEDAGDAEPSTPRPRNRKASDKNAE